MTQTSSSFKLASVFSDIQAGNFHASSQLDTGDTALISCKTKESGIEGFFDIPKDKTFVNCVTIACDGEQPSTAYYHPYRFAAKDNVIVCTPRENIRRSTILYAIAYINRERWRFSYGRKCYSNKIDKIRIMFPVDESGEIDQNKIEATYYARRFSDFLPEKTIQDSRVIKVEQFGLIPISKLFDLHSGEYHKAADLPNGKIPLISCGDLNNGTVGYYNIPSDKLFENALTISHNGQPLTTKFHPYQFAGKDDIAICVPKVGLRPSTMVFLQFVINRERWRYSFGRKCFLRKMMRLQLCVPVTNKGELDEDAIEKLVENLGYWEYFEHQVIDKMNIAKMSVNQLTS